MDYLPNIKRKRLPEEEANFFSQLFFLYTLNTFVRGYQKNLNEEDLYSTPSKLKTETLGNRFEELWQRQQTKQKKPSLVAILLKIHGFYYILLGLSQVLIKTIIIILHPFLVGRFSLFFAANQTDLTRSQAYLYGLSILVVVFLENLYDQWYSLSLTTLEIRIRGTLTVILYRRILLWSSLYVDNVGKIITLITKDVHNLEMCIRHANKVWISTIQGIILFYLLLKSVGFVVLILVVFFTFLLPIQACLATKCAFLKRQMLKETDDRLQVINDVLVSLRIIKMVTWENKFQEKLSNIRRNEMNLTHRIFLLKFMIRINGILWICATFSPLMAIFIAVGQEVKPETIFFIFDSYRTMGYLLIITLPLSLAQIAETIPSITRMENFFRFKDFPKNLRSQRGCKIVLKDVSVTFKKELVLKNINLELESGLVVITGRSGSGKSFLLKTIIGECELTRGKATTEGTISHACQKPWIFLASIRQNILLGEEFDQKRYNEVLRICGLAHSLEEFRNGDQTVLGTNGVNLSKSLLARINLARAVYKNCDIYLLDDPFETLDPFLADSIFQECAKFLRKRLVLLVMKTPFSKFQQSVILQDGEAAFSNVGGTKEGPKIRHQFKLPSGDEETDLPETDDEDEETRLLQARCERNVLEKSQKIGEVELNVYKKWVAAGGGAFWFSVVICLLLVLPMMMRLFEYSIGCWSENEEDLTNFIRIKNETQTVKELLEKRKNYITLQILAILGLLVTYLGSSVTFLGFFQRTSVTLHDLVTQSVINTKMTYSNTIDNILNRFSRDLLNMDEILPFSFYNLFKTVIPFVSATILVGFTDKISLISLLFLIATLTLMKMTFLASARNLKRLEASTKSPVVGHVRATLDGLATITSQKTRNILQEEFSKKLDLHISASYTYLCITLAFSLFRRLASAVFLGMVIHRSLQAPIDPKSVSFVILQSLLLVQILDGIFHNWAQFETNMTSTERILEISESKQEFKRSLHSWPEVPDINFHNVSLSCDLYNKPVLQDLSFSVQFKEKIGILGASGSGKSCLLSALLNIDDFEGSITVGGVDVRMLSRSNISLVPQEATIFRGSVRENLDPYNKYADTDIWNVLESVNLKKFIWDLNEDIDNTYIVGNSKYKELFSLAKVIIENNSIVLLDEVFTSVDEEIEDFICDAIKKNFEKSTVLIATHNLRILSCCDRIMVLDDGQIAEFGSFSELLRNEDGALLKLSRLMIRRSLNCQKKCSRKYDNVAAVTH